MKKWFRLSLVIYLVSFSYLSEAQYGKLPLVNYSREDMGRAHSQNRAVAQTENGLIYVANVNHVLEYDGNTWSKIELVDGAKCYYVFEWNNEVYVGGYNTFGKLVSTDKNQKKYVAVNSNFKDFGEVWKVEAWEDEVFFMSSKTIFVFNTKEQKITRSIGAKKRFRSVSILDGELIYFEDEIGLKSESTSVISSTDFKIYKVLRCQNRTFVVTRKNGVFELIDNQLRPFYTYKDGIQVLSAAVSAQKQIALGTYGNGVFMLDLDGNVQYRVNKNLGLQNDVIHHLYFDNYQNLWISTDNGVTQVETSSQFRTYDDYAGITGTIEASEYFAGHLFVASSTGLYAASLHKGNNYQFKVFSNKNYSAWTLNKVYFSDGKSYLLVCMDDGVYKVDQALNMNKIYGGAVWSTTQSTSDSSTIFVNKLNGIEVLNYKDDAVFEDVGSVQDFEFEVRFLEEYDQTLWATNDSKQVFNLKSNGQGWLSASIVELDSSVLGKKESYIPIKDFKNNLTLYGPTGIYNLKKGRMEAKEQWFDQEFNQIHRMQFTSNQNWIVRYNLNDLFRTESRSNDSEANESNWKAYSLLNDQVIHTITEDVFGNIWFGGTKSLMKLNAASVSKPPIPKVNIRGFYFNNDSLGLMVNEKQHFKKDIKHGFNSVLIEFSSDFSVHPEANQYSVKMEGFDKDWKAWDKKTEANYTNLHEGSYTFFVKTRNKYAQESEIKEFSFVISAPWYRTWWAYILYLLAAVSTVFLLVRWRTQALIKSNQLLEETVAARTKTIKEKNEEILASINYAQRIQKAMMSADDHWDKIGSDKFILFRPRDIVSGDFYWASLQDGISLWAAADCTGHGVPGAFMSMLGIGFLNEIVNEQGITDPAKILFILREKIIQNMEQKGADIQQKDGMDIALCALNHKEQTLTFAGAYNPLLLLTKTPREISNSRTMEDDGKILYELKATKQPIGKHQNDTKPFESTTIQLLSGDLLYSFSDGYADQFGGPKGKKFMIKKFKKMLLENFDSSMEAQHKLLNSTFEDWMQEGETEQIDDVCVIGVKI